MRECMCFLTLLAWLAAGGSGAAAERRLVAIGGGDWPEAATRRFVEWSGGPRARLLLVLWATSVPDESYEDMRAEFAKHGPAAIEAAPLGPLDADGRARLLEQLEVATGVFFSGGDQARIMAVLGPDPDLLARVRTRYAAGVTFGGTSAGTAVMTTPMITGEGDFTVIDGSKVETAPGLDLLPGVVLDQHFVKRQRQNRLFGLVLAQPGLLGVGVDEATALLVRGERRAEVVGRGQVLVVDGRAGRGSLRVEVLRDGQQYDLRRRRRLGDQVALPKRNLEAR